MDFIVPLKNFNYVSKNIFTLSNNNFSNALKISFVVLGIFSVLGIFFSEKIFSYSKLILKPDQLKTESKNLQTNKSKMKYKDFPRTKEQEEALDVIMDGISLGREGISLKTLKKITSLAPSLYKAGDVVHYYESQGKIHGVHTLRHLGYVFSKKDTRQKMKTLMNYKSFLKVVKTTYLQKMSEVLNQLNKSNQIAPYLPDFVDEVTKIDKMSNSCKKELVEKLTNIVQIKSDNKWEVFIQTLLKYTNT